MHLYYLQISYTPMHVETQELTFHLGETGTVFQVVDRLNRKSTQSVFNRLHVDIPSFAVLMSVVESAV